MADDPTAKARAVAMVRFQEEEAADIANYTVLTNEMENSFEIVFVPRHPPLQVSDSGQVTVTFSGGSVFGRSVRYRISKDTYQVLNRSYAR